MEYLILVLAPGETRRTDESYNFLFTKLCLIEIGENASYFLIIPNLFKMKYNQT